MKLSKQEFISIASTRWGKSFGYWKIGAWIAAFIGWAIVWLAFIPSCKTAKWAEHYATYWPQYTIGIIGYFGIAFGGLIWYMRKSNQYTKAFLEENKSLIDKEL